MQSTCPIDNEVFETMKKQLEQKIFKASNRVFIQVKEYFDEIEKDKVIQVPDFSIDQCEEILKLTEETKLTSVKKFREMLLRLKPILEKTPSSDFQIKDGPLLHRMCKQPFESLLYNFKTTKSKMEEFIKQLQDPNFNIDIYQLRLIVACFEYKTKNRDIIQKKIDYFKANTVIKEQELLNEDQIKKYLNIKLNIAQMNQVYSQTKLLKEAQLESDRPSVVGFGSSIKGRYMSILEQCKMMQLNVGNLDSDLVYAAQNIIPLVIFKSFQIYLNYPSNFKTVECLLFIFQIPICYLCDTEVEMQPLLINNIKPNYHLKTSSGKYLHKQVINQDDSKNIIHHINGNEFHNLQSNLIEINVTQEEIDHFGIDFNSFRKHMMIHSIFNTEYDVQFFENCIALKGFDSELTFYKDFLQNHLNDPQRLEYEMDNTYYKRLNNKIDDIIIYFRRQFKSDI